MDYPGLRRRQLQALSKEHKLSPANSPNSDELSQYLNEPIMQRRGCIKSSEATGKQAKKVRFSPVNDLFEYELFFGKHKAIATQMQCCRRSVAMKVEPIHAKKAAVECSRVTRSKARTADVGVAPDVNPPSLKKIGKEVQDLDQPGTEIMDILVKSTRSRTYKIEWPRI